MGAHSPSGVLVFHRSEEDVLLYFISAQRTHMSNHNDCRLGRPGKRRGPNVDYFCPADDATC